MAIDISGVTLPNVPANVLVRYPSAVILKMTSGDTTVYALLAATNFFGHATKNIISSMEYEEMLGSLGAGRAYYAQADASVWDVGSGEVAAGELMLPVGTVDNATVTLVWANHDVLEITSLDTSTGDYTTGGVYFAQTADTSTGTGNNDASIYRIRRSRLAGIGDQVRRLTEVSPDLTPEEIEAMLAELDITLEEAYVTPTTEQQEIYPSAYGFSKIIVEAVEDSGTSGGGGTPGGGEGGDDPEPDTTPDVSSGAFGNVPKTEGESQFTGNYIYGGRSIPALPAYDTEKYPYATILAGNNYALYLTAKPYYVEANSQNAQLNPAQNYYYYYIYNGKWMNGGSNSTSPGVLSKVIWANYDIMCNATGLPIVSKSTPKPEFDSTIETNPVEVEGEYTVSGDDLNTLGAIAQKITGTDTAMTWDEIKKALESTVTTPTTTE